MVRAWRSLDRLDGRASLRPGCIAWPPTPVSMLCLTARGMPALWTNVPWVRRSDRRARHMSNTILKSTGAVLAGLIFIVITSTVMDTLLENTGVLPKGNLFVDRGSSSWCSVTGLPQLDWLLSHRTTCSQQSDGACALARRDRRNFQRCRHNRYGGARSCLVRMDADSTRVADRVAGREALRVA